MSRINIQDISKRHTKSRNFLKRGIDIGFWVYRFKWNYYPRLRIVNHVPLHVDIEVTDACNLKCCMCVHGMEGVPDAGFIDKDLAFRAIDECGRLGVPSIKFNFRGEPLLHPNLVDFVKRAKEKGILEVQFNTNGLPVTNKKIEDLIKYGLDRIIFSVDGATKETYEKIRVGGKYEKLIRNIETFIEIRKRLKRNKPFIRVQMVKAYGAEKEVEQFLEFWHEKKVENISVITKQERDNKSGYPLLNGKKPIGRAFCEQPWQRLNINRDGMVLMCCGDWERKSIIGDFKKNSIQEIWQGENMAKMRRAILHGELDNIPACKTCFRPTAYKWE